MYYISVFTSFSRILRHIERDGDTGPEKHKMSRVHHLQHAKSHRDTRLTPKLPQGAPRALAEYFSNWRKWVRDVLGLLPSPMLVLQSANLSAMPPSQQTSSTICLDTSSRATLIDGEGVLQLVLVA